MILRTNRQPRRGALLPLTALLLVIMFAFLAFAIDIGMLLVEKTQAQNAADSAAMTGARSINGSPGQNLANATTNATNNAQANLVLGAALAANEIIVAHGAFHYDTVNQVFIPQFPPVSPDNYNLTKVTISPSRGSAFARVLGVPTLNVSVSAIASHRPRDTSLVLDYSGSMNNEGDIWVVEPEYGAANYNTPNNLDATFPKFGVYDPNYSPLATLQCTSNDPRVGRCNVTQAALGIGPLVNDLFQNDIGQSAVQAFNPAPASVTNTSPGGDNYLPMKNSTTPAKNWSEITGSPSTGFNGYPSFNGWTQGPGYWGKTFFMWPPDPRPANDWRKKFFFLADGITPLNNDLLLFNPAGGLNSPPGNYVINYKAILSWISANCLQSSPTDSKPFPSKMRGGRILYYSQIPSDVPGSPTDQGPSSAYNHMNPNRNIADQNQRFWKEYIDYTLGVWRDPQNNNIQSPVNPACSIGGYFTPGTSQAGQGIVVTGPDVLDPNGRFYVSPLDNPRRPLHTFWFGPMTMIQFMSDTGHLPGTAHDISMFTAKLGLQAAVQDISNNHPNDLVSLCMYSRPTYNANGPGGNADPPGIGQFNSAQINLSKDYTALVNAMYYPPGSNATTDVNSFSSNDVQTPRAHADYNANTATNYGFMLAYNQFSNTAYAPGLAGNGRKGASRLVILETDGMANTASGATFVSSISGTTNNSYYKINTAGGDQVYLDNPGPAPGAPTYSSSGAGQAACNTATKLCAQVTDTTIGPGFSTPSKPCIIHVLAFGAVIEPVAQPPVQQGRVMTLGNFISQIGGTGFPPDVNATNDPNYYKLIIGDQPTRLSRMQQAFIKIMDSDVPCSLVQ